MTMVYTPFGDDDPNFSPNQIDLSSALPERPYNPTHTPASIAAKPAYGGRSSVQGGSPDAARFVEQFRADPDNAHLFSSPSIGQRDGNQTLRRSNESRVANEGFDARGRQVQHRHQPHPAAQVDWSEQFPRANESDRDFEARQGQANRESRERNADFLRQMRGMNGGKW